MRRMVLLIALMLIPAISLLTFVVLSNVSGSPEVAHTAESYLKSQKLVGAQLEYQRAAHPSALHAGDSVNTHGRSYYFQTSSEAEISRPLPYPPSTIWCVTATAHGKTLRMFVAEHQDLYVGQWVVHEPVPDAVWAKVGCN